MKRNYFLGAIVAFGLACSMGSCSDDPDPVDNTDTTVEAKDIEYTSENAVAWGNYMYNVANLLKKDAADLYGYWSEDYNGESFATTFKSHNKAPYTSAISCVQEIIEKCAEIANEVGVAKIGEPYDFYQAGKTEEALYAVESWYSWHSRDDYTNNIWSIRNCYFGKVDDNDKDDEGDIAENSISRLIASVDPEMDAAMRKAIQDAADAIQAIPQPFRNNINSNESKAAMEACSVLEEALTNMSAYVQSQFSSAEYDSRLDAIVAQYVDYVVLPTYKSLREGNESLFNAVSAFRSNPSDEAFQKACNAWLVAREPWEKSEGFLFGPVDSEGLDPNMDSWPLDQNAIVQILESGNFDNIEWGEGDSEETVTAAQNVRGYHTLEFLLFKDGEPRKVK